MRAEIFLILIGDKSTIIIIEYITRTGEPMQTNNDQHREILKDIAYHAMLDRGLLPEFSPEALAELNRITMPAPIASEPARDLRNLLWASIDNDDSLDLDQLSVGEALDGGRVKILVAVADVDALVKKGSAIDTHAQQNTTSVYTPAEIFPMLPEKLSTDLTSLNYNQDRLSIVIEMVMNTDGSLQASDVYLAAVRNHAKLAYPSVGAWLQGDGAMPEAVAAVSGLAENLRLQDQAAQNMKSYRHAHGALSFETIEAKPVFEGDTISRLEFEHRTRADEIIENLMITANGVTARFLTAKNYPSIRRVVLVPKRWDRIMEIAEEHGVKLPGEPASKPLEDFLVQMKQEDPQHFPDLSLAIIKLLGPGEYVAEKPGENMPGHFGLAAKDYTHSTAPNRRFSDLVTERLLKAALAGMPSPYEISELESLAQHCTDQEDAANKVERQVTKSAAALLLESRIGEQFDAFVTGASEKGTWVRLLKMPVEGRLEVGYEGLDVGHRVRVQLISVDVNRGFIDFKRVH